MLNSLQGRSATRVRQLCTRVAVDRSRVREYGQLLKQRRIEFGYTQEELAALVGYSVASIRKLEGGQRTPSKQLAALLSHHLDLPALERTARPAATDFSQGSRPVAPASNLPAAPLTALI